LLPPVVATEKTLVKVWAIRLALNLSHLYWGWTLCVVTKDFINFLYLRLCIVLLEKAMTFSALPLQWMKSLIWQLILPKKLYRRFIFKFRDFKMLIIPWNDWLVAKKLRLEHNFNGYIHLKVFQALAMNCARGRFIRRSIEYESWNSNWIRTQIIGAR
jgi:hypothetical protein